MVQQSLYQIIGADLFGFRLVTGTDSMPQDIMCHGFHVFWRDFLSSIDIRTTVVVIGDARNNYNDPRAWCLREIHRKAKNLIWINPEAPGAWGFGDSAMDRYLPYCDVAEECRNLKQLSRMVDRLLL